MGRVPLVAVATALLAAGCTTTEQSGSSSATARGDQCFSAGLARSFRPAGRDAVDVEVNRRSVYRLSLGAGCLDINWAERVALRSRGGGSFICSADDAELIVPSSIGPDRCLVTDIRRLSEAEIQESRRR